VPLKMHFSTETLDLIMVLVLDQLLHWCGVITGWSYSCPIFHSIHLHWFEKCCKWILASERRWLFSV